MTKLLRNFVEPIHLVTCEPPSNLIVQKLAPRDEDFQNHKITRIAQPEYSLLKKLYLRFFPTIANLHIKQPDPFKGWAKKVSAFILAHWSEFSTDVIVSFSDPKSSHLVAMPLARKFKVPWIASLSDPWVDNPYTHMNFLSRLINQWLEWRVIKNADALIFSSEETRNTILRKYSDRYFHKAHILEHGYENSPRTERDPRKKTDRFIIRFVGNFYGIRSPLPLIEALKYLLKAHPALADRITFEFIGTCSNYDLTQELKSLPLEFVKEIPTVPYPKAIELIYNADLLVVTDAPAKQNIFFPSKLGEYLGTDVPIFAVTPPGTSARIIHGAGGYICDPLRQDDVSKTFIRAIQDLVNGREVVTEFNKAFRRKYAMSNHVEKLENIIRKYVR